jgi:hypothetical protein
MTKANLLKGLVKLSPVLAAQLLSWDDGYSGWLYNQPIKDVAHVEWCAAVCRATNSVRLLLLCCCAGLL